MVGSSGRAISEGVSQKTCLEESGQATRPPQGRHSVSPCKKGLKSLRRFSSSASATRSVRQRRPSPSHSKLFCFSLRRNSIRLGSEGQSLRRPQHSNPPPSPRAERSRALLRLQREKEVSKATWPSDRRSPGDRACTTSFLPNCTIRLDRAESRRERERASWVKGLDFRLAPLSPQATSLSLCRKERQQQRRLTRISETRVVKHSKFAGQGWQLCWPRKLTCPWKHATGSESAPGQKNPSGQGLNSAAVLDAPLLKEASLRR